MSVSLACESRLPVRSRIRSECLRFLVAIFLSIGRVGIWVRKQIGICVRLLHQAFQERSAPSTTGPCTKALRQLAGYLWLIDTDELHHLSFGDVKAETEFIIILHRLHLR